MSTKTLIKKISKSIKNSRILRTATGYGAYFIFKVLSSTYKLNVIADKNSKQTSGIYYFWHQNLIGSVLFLKKNQRNINCIVSPSNDGKIAGSVCEKLGFNVLYGSSYKSPVALIKKTLRSLKKDPRLFVVGDGSRGPAFNLQPGIVKLAKTSNLPLIFLECSASSFFTMKKSWDQFQIPKPFSTITIKVHQQMQQTENSN